MSAVSPKNLQVAQILQEDVSSQIHDCHPGHCVPSLYLAMTGVWPGDTSHHTPGLCHRKTEQKLWVWASSLTTATGKNWGMRRNKTSQWGKKQPWSRPGPGKWRQGLEEMRITRVWDVAMIAWSEPRVPSVHLSSHAWHNSASCQLSTVHPKCLVNPGHWLLYL